MTRTIDESDWKILRQLREVALDRFCERVLGEIGEIASRTRESNHARFLAIHRLADRRNEELAHAFDNPRRSTAFFQLARIQSQGLLTEDEFARFGPETRALVDVLLGNWSD